MALDAKQTAKLLKLVGAYNELRSKEDAIMAEIDDLLGGGAGLGDRMAKARIAFCSAWTTRYGGNYVWNFAKDNPNLKRLVLTLGVDEVEARIERFIVKGDDYFGKVRHSFGSFVATINQHVGKAAAASANADFELEKDFALGVAARAERTGLRQS